MLILHDENNLITGIQTYPLITNLTHIIIDDSNFDVVSKAVNHAHLVDTGNGLELPANIEILAEEKELIDLTDKVRMDRDFKLIQLDSVVSNPLRFNGLSDGQKTAYADYRQALLDITVSEGFPVNMIWPEMPD